MPRRQRSGLGQIRRDMYLGQRTVGDFEAAITLLKVLAVKDPRQAEVVYGSMMAVLDSSGDD